MRGIDDVYLSVGRLTVVDEGGCGGDCGFPARGFFVEGAG